MGEEKSAFLGFFSTYLQIYFFKVMERRNISLNYLE